MLARKARQDNLDQLARKVQRVLLVSLDRLAFQDLQVPKASQGDRDRKVSWDRLVLLVRPVHRVRRESEEILVPLDCLVPLVAQAPRDRRDQLD